MPPYLTANVHENGENITSNTTQNVFRDTQGRHNLKTEINNNRTTSEEQRHSIQLEIKDGEN